MCVCVCVTRSQGAEGRQGGEGWDAVVLGGLCLAALTLGPFLLLIGAVHLHLILPLFTAGSAGHFLFDADHRLRWSIWEKKYTLNSISRDNLNFMLLHFNHLDDTTICYDPHTPTSML